MGRHQWSMGCHRFPTSYPRRNLQSRIIRTQPCLVPLPVPFWDIRSEQEHLLMAPLNRVEEAEGKRWHGPWMECPAFPQSRKESKRGLEGQGTPCPKALTGLRNQGKPWLGEPNSPRCRPVMKGGGRCHSGGYGEPSVQAHVQYGEPERHGPGHDLGVSTWCNLSAADREVIAIALKGHHSEGYGENGGMLGTCLLKSQTLSTSGTFEAD